MFNNKDDGTTWRGSCCKDSVRSSIQSGWWGLACGQHTLKVRCYCSRLWETHFPGHFSMTWTHIKIHLGENGQENSGSLKVPRWLYHNQGPQDLSVGRNWCLPTGSWNYRSFLYNPHLPGHPTAGRQPGTGPRPGQQPQTLMCLWTSKPRQTPYCLVCTYCISCCIRHTVFYKKIIRKKLNIFHHTHSESILLVVLLPHFWGNIVGNLGSEQLVYMHTVIFEGRGIFCFLLPLVLLILTLST